MSGEFVARMEDIPVPTGVPSGASGSGDETSRQTRPPGNSGEVRPPLEAAPGRVARYDTEYQRNGTRNLFMIGEPRGGWDLWR